MNDQGKLYIVATPIGNKDDITIRAIHILQSVSLIAAEDTRHTGMLLSDLNISTPLISCHEHNEKDRAEFIIRKISEGGSVALVSDAGTPGISDPGYRIITQAIENNIQIVPIPGVTAIITALSASGLPTDSFTFIGFPAKKGEKRKAQLKSLANHPETVIFYESPKRVLSLMEDILDVMGNRRAVLCRELTKVYEEFIRAPLSEIIQQIKNRPNVKGECTLLIQGFDEKQEVVSMEEIQKEIEIYLSEKKLKLSDLSKEISERYGVSKNIVYAQALKFIKERNYDEQS